MGKGGLGTLLELGPEGDMGPCDVALLCHVYTFEDNGTDITQGIVYGADFLICLSPDVLVGGELPSVGSG